MPMSRIFFTTDADTRLGAPFSVGGALAKQTASSFQTVQSAKDQTRRLWKTLKDFERLWKT